MGTRVSFNFRSMVWAAAWVCAFLALMRPAFAGVTMVVEPAGTRCVYQDLEQDALAKGVYEVGDASEKRGNENAHTGILVYSTSPDGDELFRKENALDGKFAFTAPVQGAYACCFENRALVPRTVTLNFLSGVAAKTFPK